MIQAKNKHHTKSAYSYHLDKNHIEDVEEICKLMESNPNQRKETIKNSKDLWIELLPPTKEEYQLIADKNIQLSDKCSFLEKQYCNLKKTNQQLEKNQSSLEESLKKKNSSMKGKLTRIRNLTHKNNQLKNSLNALITDYEKITKALDEKLKETEAFSRTLETLTSDYLTIEEKNDEYLKRINYLEDKLNNYQSKEKFLKQTIRDELENEYKLELTIAYQKIIDLSRE